MAAPPWGVVPLPLHVSWEEVSVVLMKSVAMAWSVERTTARTSILRQSRVTHVARVSQVTCHISITQCFQIIPIPYYFLITRYSPNNHCLFTPALTDEICQRLFGDGPFQSKVNCIIPFKLIFQ